MRRLVLVVLALVLTAGSAAAQVKVEIFCISGAATAAGTLDFRIVARGAACAATAVTSHSQAYDGVAGGGTPTTSTEVAALVAAGLAAGAPAGVSVALAGDPNCIRVRSSTDIDLCVDGNKLNLNGTYTENGLTVVTASKTKVPTVSTWGLILLSTLLIGVSLVAWRRYRQQLA